MRNGMIVLLLLLMEISVVEGALKVRSVVPSRVVKVEIHDLSNPQATKKFSLDNKQEKTTDVVGLKCKVKVFATNGELMVEGEFPSGQSVEIQPSGSKWVLRRVSN